MIKTVTVEMTEEDAPPSANCDGYRIFTVRGLPELTAQEVKALHRSCVNQLNELGEEPWK